MAAITLSPIASLQTTYNNTLPTQKPLTAQNPSSTQQPDRSGTLGILPTLPASTSGGIQFIVLHESSNKETPCWTKCNCLGKVHCDCLGKVSCDSLCNGFGICPTHGCGSNCNGKS